MRATRSLFIGLTLSCISLASAHAVPTDEATVGQSEQTDTAPKPQSSEALQDAAAPTVEANDHLVYLPATRLLAANAKKAFAAFDVADRQALEQFYAARMGSALWVDKNGLLPDAKSLITAFETADNWGLRSTDYKAPSLKAEADGTYKLDDLANVETRLSLLALKYARDARGGRIADPRNQLSEYLDRAPQTLDPRTVIDSLVKATDKAAYLESLQPKQPQFELLRQKLLALRSGTENAKIINIPNGPSLKPGQSHSQIAMLRKALEAPAAIKRDGSPAEDTYYDDGLARAVQDYKKKKGIEPASAVVTNVLRRSLSTGEGVSERALLSNMEEWRWMPDDLGKFHIEVNLPEFNVRVVKDGAIVHEERIVTGSIRTQTPIFSDMMRTIVFQPRWNVPDSIKIKELLPGLRAGGDPLRRRGLVMERNGRKVNVTSINWYRNDIRNYHVYQPPGGSNALGVVKFLFPNKHAVYLHDTPSKSLFTQNVRAFSHGCMRVRNPLELADAILGEDQGWSKETIASLVSQGPEENEITLATPIPVHVTYFTARVNNAGDVETFGDIYGHEKRITLALQGRWREIVKTKEPKISPDDIGGEDGWYGADSRNNGDYYYDERGRRRKTQTSGVGKFLQQVFGGGF
ncbi:L,D-transpeptidase [Hyphomicrobium methylovorum]|uniref:L,D-transpeptidase family protein n=1 Tax=Hyphomicrobium methylovorum TaxID=84 RepID=UPI0015E6B500|nr:L,D-transpeptidase family protein [Hyphomicrobium methylovorum]MBA2126817.1 L,D-transpeptidase [Hyphomicrobium methylovorum]